MARENDTLVEMLCGAAAGLAATWVMGRLTTFLYENEDPAARRREDRVRGNKSAYGLAAERSAALVGRELTDGQRQQAGNLLHWVLGATGGAAYAALRHRVPAADAGSGALFGLVFFLAMDEGVNAGLGLTPGPLEFPWQAHARGLAGHLTYGVATEAVLRAFDRVV